MKNILLLIIMLSAFSSFAFAEEVDLYFFYGQGCPHCGKEEIFLEDMETKYPELNVYKNEVYFDNNNLVLFQQMAKAFDTEIRGVPTTFINGKVIVGFSDSIGNEIEQEIMRCVDAGCDSPISKINGEIISGEIVVVEGDSSPAEEPGKTKFKEQLTLGAVISAAAIDAINPCAFAVLIILMTTILVTKNKRKALEAGLAFSLCCRCKPVAFPNSYALCIWPLPADRLYSF